MPEIGTERNKSAFIGPVETEWRSLSAVPDGDEDEMRSIRTNLDELHNALLASLQMQHLVVLAGSGCSLAAGGPSMGDLWDAAVGNPVTTSAKNVAEKVSYKIAERNIEAFLSRIEAFLHLQDDPSLTAFLIESKKIILERCSSFITPEALESHQVFLHRLSRRRVRDNRLKFLPPTTIYVLNVQLVQ